MGIPTIPIPNIIPNILILKIILIYKNYREKTKYFSVLISCKMVIEGFIAKNHKHYLIHFLKIKNIKANKYFVLKKHLGYFNYNKNYTKVIFDQGLEGRNSYHNARIPFNPYF